MRALELVGFDGPASLQIAERPEAEPGQGEVRVRMRNMALNHLDVFITRGLPKRPLPAVLGSDGAGSVHGPQNGESPFNERGDRVPTRIRVRPRGVRLGVYPGCRPTATAIR